MAFAIRDWKMYRFFNLPFSKSINKYHIKRNFRAVSKLGGICQCNSIEAQVPQMSSLWNPLYVVTRGLKSAFDEDDLDEKKTKSHLFSPVHYSSPAVDEGIAVEIAGPLAKKDIMNVIEKFFIDKTIKELSEEQGLDRHLYQQTAASFRIFCMESESLPTDLHIVISDISKGASHVHDLYPFFFKHARNIFPHLDCIDELHRISDLTQPPNWYPNARIMNRKIIYHAGPTNSGKTYHAMEQYLAADSGVYCGPLKLLASEIFRKSNERGVPCDLVTGEEKKFAISADEPSPHVACTIEMASVNTTYDVAIIDEIQMIRDYLRGWAWTRSLLGISASEIHVCGEGSAIKLVKQLAQSVGEDVEVRRYKRLTTLTIEKEPLNSYENVKPGDCIVCFNKQTLLKTAQIIEKNGFEVGVIYGSLPPTSKLVQAEKFNDPNHPCKVLIATDAIGMGLNLSIRRIIFSSLMKPTTNAKGEKEMDVISCSQALQIAGRAGRFGTQFEEGFVTTVRKQDLQTLNRVLASTPEDVEHAGIHPTPEQVELFSYHLPSYTLSNLIDIFTNICSLDSSLYFLCHLEDFKYLADLIQHIPLPLRTRYIFCCSPIGRKKPFVAALFLKFARQYSQGEMATVEWLCRQIKWPLDPAASVDQLIHLENVFDVFDLYLWLSYRLPDMFPDGELVRGMQAILDSIISDGVSHITKLGAPTKGFIPVQAKAIPLQKSNSDEIRRLSTSVLKKGKNKPKSRKRLTDSLLMDGTLSEKMLQILKKEWMEEDQE